MNRFEKEINKNHFVPSCTLGKTEQGTVYEMDTKYKVNWKLTIRWIIFNIGFSF